MHVITEYDTCRTTVQARPDPSVKGFNAEELNRTGSKCDDSDSTATRHGKARKMLTVADAASSSSIRHAASNCSDSAACQLRGSNHKQGINPGFNKVSGLQDNLVHEEQIPSNGSTYGPKTVPCPAASLKGRSRPIQSTHVKSDSAYCGEVAAAQVDDGVNQPLPETQQLKACCVRQGFQSCAQCIRSAGVLFDMVDQARNHDELISDGAATSSRFAQVIMLMGWL